MCIQDLEISSSLDLEHVHLFSSWWFSHVRFRSFCIYVLVEENMHECFTLLISAICIAKDKGDKAVQQQC